MNFVWSVCVLYACAALGEVSVRRVGWLERAASYYRGLFLNSVEHTAPVQIRASFEHSKPGADEGGTWDYASVERLLALLGASEGAAPVRRALRRMLRPSNSTRRFISKKDSWKLFPSLGKKHVNNIYYDFDPQEESSEEQSASEFDYSDDAVLVLENPVEARLPSARISVKLLRDILENRALAARSMPSTVKSTIPWIPMNKTSASQAAAESTTGAGGGESSADAGGFDTTTGADAATTTTTAAPDLQ